MDLEDRVNELDRSPGYLFGNNGHNVSKAWLDRHWKIASILSLVETVCSKQQNSKAYFNKSYWVAWPNGQLSGCPNDLRSEDEIRKCIRKVAVDMERKGQLWEHFKIEATEFDCWFYVNEKDKGHGFKLGEKSAVNLYRNSCSCQ